MPYKANTIISSCEGREKHGSLLLTTSLDQKEDIGTGIVAAD